MRKLLLAAALFAGAANAAYYQGHLIDGHEYQCKILAQSDTAFFPDTSGTDIIGRPAHVTHNLNTYAEDGTCLFKDNKLTVSAPLPPWNGSFTAVLPELNINDLLIVAAPDAPNGVKYDQSGGVLTGTFAIAIDFQQPSEDNQ